MKVKLHEREPLSHDVIELQNALTIARIACARFKNKVPYAGNLYDAAEDVIHACDEMAKEVRDVRS
jgi:hypothetical protein